MVCADRRMEYCSRLRSVSDRVANTIILSAGFLNIGIGIVNNRRILAGKKPW